MNAKRLRNASSYLISQIANKFIFYIIILIIIGRLGQEGLGRYSYVFAFVGFFSIVLNFGVFTPAVRQLSRGKTQINRHVSSLIVVKLILSLTFCAMVLVFLKLSRNLQATGIILIMLSSVVNSISEIFIIIFVSFEKMGYYLLDIVFDGSLVVIILLAPGFSENINMVFLAYLVMSIIRFFILFAIVAKLFPRLALLIDIGLSVKLVKESLVFALIGLGAVLFYNIDVLVLTKSAGFGAVALFDLPFRIISVLVILPASIVFAAFPSMVLLNGKSKKLPAKFKQIFRLSLYIALPLFTALFILAEKIMLTFFGEAFQGSVSVLRILCALGLLLTLHMLLRTVLYSINKDKANVYALLAGGAVNIILCFLFVSRWGIAGVAFATAVAYAVVVAVCYLNVRTKLQGIGFFRLIYKTVIATTIMALVLVFSFALNLFLLIALGVIVYVVTMYITGELHEAVNDLKQF